jgi:hypothetical protein
MRFSFKIQGLECGASSPQATSRIQKTQGKRLLTLIGYLNLSGAWLVVDLRTDTKNTIVNRGWTNCSEIVDSSTY